MFLKIVVGGTFDILHDGHRKLLQTAFENAKSVIIGLTSDEFADRFRTTPIRKYALREKDLEGFVCGFNCPFEIVEISDSYGVATLDEEIDCIVVSEETLLRAEEINTIRFKKGLDKISIIVIPLVLGSNGRPLSASTRT